MLKRGRETLESASKKSNKKPRINIAATVLPQRDADTMLAKGQQDVSRSNIQVPKAFEAGNTRSLNVSKAALRSDVQAPNGRRGRAPFKPLTITSATKSTSVNGDLPNAFGSLPQRIVYNDHSLHIPELQNITYLPTPGSTRKAQDWSIILSGINDGERFICCLVSKTIRYAGGPRSCLSNL